MENRHIPDCQTCEVALSDYIDGTLAPELRPAVEAHLAECPSCTLYLADIEEGLLALRYLDEATPSPILVNKILYRIPQKESSWRAWLGRFFEPVLQPRIVMGAMMTVLSLAMMTRCAGVPNRPLNAGDLDPARIWVTFDDRVQRTWDRTVKAYESMRLVYEVRSRVHEWQQQQDEQDSAASDAAANEQLKSRVVKTQQKSAEPAPSAVPGQKAP